MAAFWRGIVDDPDALPADFSVAPLTTQADHVGGNALSESTPA